MTTPARTPIGPGWTPPDTFAARIWQVRRHLSKTTSEFAELIGEHPTQVSRWEHGARLRNMADVCRRIAVITGVDLFWLLYGDTPPGDPPSRSTNRHADDLRDGRNNVTFHGHFRSPEIIRLAA